jgi:hypothetical protein
MKEQEQTTPPSKTPLQMLSDKLTSKLLPTTNPNRAHNAAIFETLAEIDALLPAEKQFAQGMFDAGVKHMENILSDLNSETDFDTLYKKNEG